MAVKKVTIKVKQGVLSVTPPVVHLSTLAKDTIEWRSVPRNKPFLVCFGDRSPFTKKHFHNGRRSSGTIHRRILPSSVYKYSVEFEQKELDPGVIIDR
jgi:hypothetical protein